MKFQWEPNDIKVGRMVTTAQALQPGARPGYVLTSLYMIGYDPNPPGDEIVIPKKYNLISMADGMTDGLYTAEELAEFLNRVNNVPAHHDLVMRAFGERRTKTEGHEL